MEINSKKILLAIILILFVVSSFLLLICLHSFAETPTLTIDDFEVFSSEGFNIADYYYNYGQPDVNAVYEFNRYINNNKPKVVDWFFVQPGGNLYLTDPVDSGYGIYYFYNKNDLPVTTDIDNLIGDTIYKYKHILDNSNYGHYPFSSDYLYTDFHATDVNYPVLIGLHQDIVIDYDKSSGITRTFYDSEFGVEVDVTRSSYAPDTDGSVVGRVYGTNLPTYGTVKVDLYKENLSTGVADLIEEKVGWFGTLDSSFSYNFDCPPLEIGSYYLYARFISEREILYEAEVSFELDGTIKDYNAVIVRDDETYYVDSAYFNKVFKISSPKHYNLYNDDIWFEIQTPLSKDGGFTTTNILGNFVYTDSFGLIDILLEDNPNPKKLNRKVDVYLNNVLIKEYDFKHFASATGYLPTALLNRGKNTLFVVSNQKMYEEGPVYFKWLAPDGTYRFIHSSVEFFYKTKDGSSGLIVETEDFSGGSSGGGGGSGGGGAFSDSPNDGSSGKGYIGFTGLDTPPDRSNYTDDIFGTIGYGLDFIVYVISMPFKVLFGGLEWLISNFLTLFSWVGQLSSIIGSWFNFLPREVRSLLLGAFMCSIIAFVLKLFRK